MLNEGKKLAEGMPYTINGSVEVTVGANTVATAAVAPPLRDGYKIGAVTPTIRTGAAQVTFYGIADDSVIFLVRNFASVEQTFTVIYRILAIKEETA